MTEAEWLAYTNPATLAEWARVYGTPRKYRLLNCACCRILAPWFVSTHLAECVGRAELYADGELGERTFRRWGQTADELGRAAHGHPAAFQRAAEAVRGLFSSRSITFPSNWDAWRALFIDRGAYGEPLRSTAPEVLRGVVRDVFGNPFRPVAFAPEWRTDTVVTLARQTYESRDFGAMPILADALQDAGCDSEEVLIHCRGSGPHVRGCWVCDLVLGKD